MKQTKILTDVTHVNGWEPAVYMSHVSQNFRLFHVSNLSVLNFRIFLLMYPGSSVAGGRPAAPDRPPMQVCSMLSAFRQTTIYLFIWVRRQWRPRGIHGNDLRQRLGVAAGDRDGPTHNRLTLTSRQTWTSAHGRRTSAAVCKPAVSVRLLKTNVPGKPQSNRALLSVLNCRASVYRTPCNVSLAISGLRPVVDYS